MGVDFTEFHTCIKFLEIFQDHGVIKKHIEPWVEHCSHIWLCPLWGCFHIV